MIKATIVEKTFNFRYSLEERSCNDMLVLHHTGGSDIDASAEQIHDWYINADYSGIGYTYSENSHSIGIHLSGDFESATPRKISLTHSEIVLSTKNRTRWS